MLKKCLITLSILFSVLQQNCFAEEIKGTVEVDLFNETLQEQETPVTYPLAIEKFEQNNVIAAYSDFQKIIETKKMNEVEYVVVARKLIDFGFFDLAQLSLSKLEDKSLSENYMQNLKEHFCPKKEIPYLSEINLAEAYSDIVYNNKSKEVLKELEETYSNDDSEYVNYMKAFSAYKAEDLALAKRYIDKAVKKNPDNINYKILQVEILAENGNANQALRIIENLKQQNFNKNEIIRKLNSSEQYVLYKSAKEDWKKDYHLAYFYFYENKNSEAIKILQGIATKKKKQIVEVQALLSRIYIENKEFNKAEESALKSAKISANNVLVQNTLGDINFRNEEYNSALKNYKKASKNDKTATSLVKIAETQQKLGNEEKAKEISLKLIKEYSNCYEAYYLLSTINPTDKEKNLKEALNINIEYKEAWLRLALLSIMQEKYAEAQKYLTNAYYIDQNDFKYYYYQGLVYIGQDRIEDAQMAFSKCLQLNPNYELAKKELKNEKKTY